MTRPHTPAEPRREPRERTATRTATRITTKSGHPAQPGHPEHAGRAHRASSSARLDDALNRSRAWARTASVGTRLLAFTIDVAAISIAAGIFGIITRSPVIFAVVALELAVVLCVLEARTGLTIGNACLRLRTVRDDAPYSPGPAAAGRRGIIHLGGLLLAGIGGWAIVATAALDPRRVRRSWADRAAHTLVVTVPTRAERDYLATAPSVSWAQPAAPAGGYGPTPTQPAASLLESDHAVVSSLELPHEPDPVRPATPMPRRAAVPSTAAGPVVVPPHTAPAVGAPAAAVPAPASPVAHVPGHPVSAAHSTVAPVEVSPAAAVAPVAADAPITPAPAVPAAAAPAAEEVAERPARWSRVPRIGGARPGGVPSNPASGQAAPTPLAPAPPAATKGTVAPAADAVSAATALGSASAPVPGPVPAESVPMPGRPPRLSAPSRPAVRPRHAPEPPASTVDPKVESAPAAPVVPAAPATPASVPAESSPPAVVQPSAPTLAEPPAPTPVQPSIRESSPIVESSPVPASLENSGLAALRTAPVAIILPGSAAASAARMNAPRPPAPGAAAGSAVAPPPATEAKGSAPSSKTVSAKIAEPSREPEVSSTPQPSALPPSTPRPSSAPQPSPQLPNAQHPNAQRTSAPPTGVVSVAAPIAPPRLPRPRTEELLLVFDTGQRVQLPIPVVAVLGRKPARGSDQEREVAVRDPEGTVSKNHLRVEYQRGSVWVTDLNSSNGTRILDDEGADTRIPADSRALVAQGSRVRLGNRVFTLSTIMSGGSDE